MDRTDKHQYTLVITDMLEGFKASHNERTIAGVRAEIEKAMAASAPIIFVVTDPLLYGRIQPQLLEAVQDYDSALWTVETKFYRHGDWYSDSSGALQVAEACEVFEYPSCRFRICGVNTHICVFFTAMELSKRFPLALLQIVLGACNDQWAPDPAEARQTFEYYSRQHGFKGYVFDTT